LAVNNGVESARALPYMETYHDHRLSAASDEMVISDIHLGRTERFEVLIRRYNQRLYRVARSIVRDDGEAEDVVQDVWVRAYENLASFRNESSFPTWLIRIGVNEALARVRRRRRWEPLGTVAEVMRREIGGVLMSWSTPEEQALSGERSAVLARAIDLLPAA
jgi:RNA polymerase sigma-70 factor, ECF subfamily